MNPLRNKVIVIDPGHGGHDPGATGNGLREKDIVLSIGLSLGKILRALGAKVIYTRTTDVYVSLGKRAEIANDAKADIFISIHINAGGGVSANGVEVFSFPNSIPAMELSKAVLNQILRDKIFKVNRGNKTANFAVLRLTNMPAILTETGFIDHYGDSQIVRNKQKGIAESIAKGICNYFGVSYQTDNKPTGVDGVLYRVRKSWEDAQSQVNAYANLDSAIDEAVRTNLNVYNEKGEQVYPTGKDHWAKGYYDSLNAKGIEVSEMRFDDAVTRGEMFVLLDRITDDVKKKMI